MNIKKYSALRDTEIRVLFYLLLVASGDTMFDLPKLKEFINLDKNDNETLFKIWRVLLDLGFIDLILDEKKVVVYLKVFDTTIDLSIYCWSSKTIEDFNDFMLLRDEGLMINFVNHIYRPLALYNEDTMRPFFDKEIPMKDVNIPDKQELDRIKHNERQAQRRKDEERAKTIVEKFYGHLKKNIPITLTEKLRTAENQHAMEFCKQYPEFPIEYIEEGIKWFLNHTFWKGVITNVSGLRKHFPKFLAQKGVKKTRTNKIKIL